MENTATPSVEIPTALPGFEGDELREKLLLDTNSQDQDVDEDEEESSVSSSELKPKKRRWQLVRTLAAFGAFIFILGLAISWFFGMGWFAKQKAQPISRGTSKDGQTAPATEDEKLKMALSMVAASTSTRAADSNPLSEADKNTQTQDNLNSQGDAVILPRATGVEHEKKGTPNSGESYSLPQAKDTPTSENISSTSSKTDGIAPALKTNDSEDARGRSLFFGISKKTAKEEGIPKPEITQVSKAELSGPLPPARIPFGTLLPVRLVGSIYTLRNSGGMVRMELTRAIEGKGYFYPAGTMVVGNVRGGEAVRAFVTITGLIDPVSGDLVKFGGELLGRDGGSGIEGKRRNLTSQWARFFQGMKETSVSVLGSVGAIRSGSSTVVLSEPIRRGTESMTGELSESISSKRDENTFLEVAAGVSGYVLVTGLPENSTNKLTREAGKE
jgi:hypothetical protein